MKRIALINLTADTSKAIILQGTLPVNVTGGSTSTSRFPPALA
jgi:hypothetical protein